MSKTHAEFLEELKQWLNDCIKDTEDCEGYTDGLHDGYMYTLQKIEQFEAEQKQVSDANR